MWRSQVVLTGAVAMEWGGTRLTRRGPRENRERGTGKLVRTNLLRNFTIKENRNKGVPGKELEIRVFKRLRWEKL